MRKALYAAALAVCSTLAPTGWIAPVRAQDMSYKPDVAAASPEALQASKSFRVAPGMKLSLFAAEPMLANPVAFGVDEHGRFYVCETFRHHAGVTDNRNHMNWLDADVASRSVDDRVAMYRKFLKPGEFEAFNVEHERIRLIEDTDGDGKADKATVFADGFKDAADGIGAGVLSRKGEVFFTCIPDLWKLKDTNNDGHADVKEALSTGYGVHVALLGHDMHGLKMGPDGRLYFSIGDRGLNVMTKEGKHLFVPDCGSILRCELDGSNLEIFASGLRNPQEIAFDNHGNFFSCDNNSDGGDKARWVYLVEGGDSGWRMGYQYLDFPIARSAWNAEKVWTPRWDGQAAYIVPPLANISDGPSGLTFDPGTGFPAKYRDHFFLADFRGSSSNSGIRSFANEPDGAAFKLVDPTQFLWSVLATDVDFGTDGSLYLTDWTNGWNKPMKGRIWKVTAEETDPNVAETRKLIDEGMDKRPVAELSQLLGHVDQRVRLAAQYELAERALDHSPFRSLHPDAIKGAPSEAFQVLKNIALDTKSVPLARIHAVWGVGQVGRLRTEKTSFQIGQTDEILLDLTSDGDAEIRAQAIKAIGELRDRPGYGVKPVVAAGRVDFVPTIELLLKDPSPRVRFFAALALGHHGKELNLGIKLGNATIPNASPSLIELLRDNNDTDAYIRHAAVMGLTGIGDVAALTKAATDPSAAVRIGALLALRRLGKTEAATFLNDSDPKIATEAGLAIYEAPIEGAMPALAGVATRKELTEPLLRRAINAANRVGRVEDAQALAEVAARSAVSKNGRVEALALLTNWAKPGGRDRINGLWRPIDTRSPETAANALKPVVGSIIKDAPDDVRIAMLKAVARLRVKDAGPDLVAMIRDSVGNATSRAEAIKALEAIDAPSLAEAVGLALGSKDGDVRAEGLRVLAKLSPDRAIPALARVMEIGSTTEKQKALDVLAAANRPEADEVLAHVLDQQTQNPDPKIALELKNATANRSARAIQEKLAILEARQIKSGPLAGYMALLEGGDRDRGRKIFRDNAAVYCIRCHKANGEGGEVGPELTDIAKKHPREYLLASIIAPNQEIAQGFESVVVAKTDGQVVAGVFKAEDEKTLKLMTAEAKLLEIAKSDIEERKRGESAMPEELHKKLTPAELRDLVEWLSSLK